MHFQSIMHFMSLWINFTVSQIASSYHQVGKKEESQYGRQINRLVSVMAHLHSFFSLIPFNMFLHFFVGFFVYKHLHKYIYIYISTMIVKYLTLSRRRALPLTTKIVWR